MRRDDLPAGFDGFNGRGGEGFDRQGAFDGRGPAGFDGGRPRSGSGMGGGMPGFERRGSSYMGPGVNGIHDGSLGGMASRQQQTNDGSSLYSMM